MIKQFLNVILSGFIVSWGLRASLQEIPVLTGIDVLEASQFKGLEGKRVGLITNHTGVNKQGVSTIDIFYRCSKVKLAALFSPEHGIRGQADHGVQVASSIDQQTKLTVHSLYSEKRRRPTPEMLRGIDALVFDIQDVGTRFYTYVTTMAYALEEAKNHNIKFYVLDRPNPINGLDVEGPLLEKEFLSFVGYFPLPLRHGMTIGELALLFNKENKIGADLEVIKMKGWRRSYWYDQTGLLWINPSPNIRNLNEATVYPCVEPLKDLGLSVGRGTDTPFEVFGAPWIDAIALAQKLNAREIEGIRFVPVNFTPTHDQFANALCGGVNLIVTDRSVFRPVKCSVEIASILSKSYPGKINLEKLSRPIGTSATADQIKLGTDPKLIAKSWEPELRRFLEMRQEFLLYD